MATGSTVLTGHARGPAWLAAVAAVGAVAGALLHGSGEPDAWQWLHWLCKPLATVSILVLAWRMRAEVSPVYRRRVLAGIGCSLVGDVLLMLPQDLFVPGLLAFLCAHLCFVAAFLDGSRFGVRPLWLLVCLGYGALNLVLLWGAIAAPLRLPVIVYVVVLACMGGQAVARARVLRGSARSASASLAAIGALLFMLSDSVLAWDRFRGPLPLAGLWILATYYLSLWCIARSVAGSGARDAP